MKFQIGEFIWHYSMYHTVEPADYGPWESIGNILDWAADTFGKPGDPWDREWDSTGERYFINGGKFFFRDRRDLTMFVLRWS
jgi:hypothetical protein